LCLALAKEHPDWFVGEIEAKARRMSLFNIDEANRLIDKHLTRTDYAELRKKLKK
jgi:hypothetical protein